MFEAGAAAVTVHGRTMEQRYRKAADWQLLQRVANGQPAPIIGNGDILTHYEVTLKLPHMLVSRAVTHLCQPACMAAITGMPD